MDIRELKRGERAGDDTDRVIVSRLPGGKFGLTGVYQAGTVTATTVTADDFATEAEALRAGMDWAEARGIRLLYVERHDA